MRIVCLIDLNALSIIEASLCENSHGAINEYRRLTKKAAQLQKVNKTNTYSVLWHETPRVMRGKNVSVTIIEQGGQYTLLKRKNTFCPYVVAFCYDEEEGTWAQGHYFNDLKSAVNFLYENDPWFKK
jgi:hypothetical protein|nr:MAG TPA: hypothetical protein [Caudoviricetes sp.]